MKIRGISALSGKISLPSNAISVVWKGRSLCYWINDLTVIRSCSLLFPFLDSLQFGARVQDWIQADQGKRKWAAEGRLRDSTRSIPIFFSTQREREYDKDTDLPQRESTQIRWGGQDGRRKPDSGLGHTQDYWTRWTDDNWVDPDSFIQRTEQPAGRKRRAGDRAAVNRRSEETAIHRDSRWDIPRKHALFTSDEPDSMTSGSDIPEGYADRPPEVDDSEGLIPKRPKDDGGTRRLYSPSIELEKVMMQLQKDVDDCRTELELARKQTPAVTLRLQRRAGFTSTPVPRYSGKSNWEQYREVFEAIVSSNGWDGVTAANSCSLIWTEMHSTELLRC